MEEGQGLLVVADFVKVVESSARQESKRTFGFEELDAR